MILRVIIVSFVIAGNIAYVHSTRPCNSNLCKAVSEEMIKFMDTSANPCLDFNKFACGGFEKENKNKNAHSLSKPIKDLEARIVKLLDGKSPIKGNFKTDKKIIDFYRSCNSFRSKLDSYQLNYNWTSYIVENVLKPSIERTMNKIGLADWPYTSNQQIAADFNWYNIIPKMVREGIVYTDGILELPIINVEVGPDDFERKTYVLKIDSPKVDLIVNDAGVFKLLTSGRSSTYIDGQFISLNKVMNILKPGGSSRSTDMLKRSLEIDQGLTPYLDWSTERIVGSLGNRKTRDYGNIFQVDPRIYNKTPISSLDRLICGTVESKDHDCTSPTWTEYLNTLFNASGNSNIHITPDEKIIVKDTSYFDALNEKLLNLKIQPFEMANYLGWKVVVDHVTVARNLRDDFHGNCVNYLLKGPENTIRRTRNGLLNAAVGSMYVRSYFDPKSKRQVDKIVDYVKKAAQVLLENIPWMDKETKDKAIKKLNNMKSFVGYPEELTSRTILDEYYKDLQIFSNPENHPSNIKAIAKFLIKTSFGNMRKKWDPNSWTLETHQTVNIVNAEYNPFLNEFSIPAGYLQNFTYNFDQPMYLNFATTATTIGHEIMHGFDINGPNSWWKES